MNNPINPLNEGLNFHHKDAPFSNNFSPEIERIPYADCIFRDGYTSQDKWDESWLDWLEAKPWKKERIYNEMSKEIQHKRVFLGIFLETTEASRYPDFLDRIAKLSDKFVYLIGQFGKIDDIRALAFTPLEWIALRRLEERYRRDVYPIMRQIFDKHFGTKYSEGDELKRRMETATKEICTLAEGCLTLDCIKEDIRGLLFHAGLENISQNTTCVESMARRHFACFGLILKNSLDDMGAFKRQFSEWNNGNTKSFIKI